MRTTSPLRPTTAAKPMTAESGVRFALAIGALVLMVLFVDATRLPLDAALVLVGASAAVAALSMPAVWAAGVAVYAWALSTGFVEHDFGRLTFTGGDLVRLGLLVTTCALVARSRPVVRRHG